MPGRPSNPIIGAMPRLPPIPRPPIGPDPLRRIRVPKDLEAITDIGEEADADAGGLDRDQIEGIWDAAVSFYKAGVHPALQLCVRRHGAVVLNRAIGHARGNGPGASDDEEKVLATTGTPFCVYSASK